MPASSQTSFTVVIPARYASSRLPGKPLADIAGKPMLQWVYERACASAAAAVVIATDDERIEAAAREFDARVCMTHAEHPSGTDRTASYRNIPEVPELLEPLKATWSRLLISAPLNEPEAIMVVS